MKVVLWAAQVLLALVFLAAGAMKLTQSLASLEDSLAWTADVPGLLVRLIGLVEVLGAFGLVLPALTRIRPGLTPLAAAGLALTVILASIFHLVRGEVEMVPMTLVLAALLAFVAWGRTTRVPIAPRAATVATA